MPELPEVQALTASIAERTAGLTLAAIDITAVSALKTADLPFTALIGSECDLVERRGKFLCLRFGDSGWLVIHLARAGWIKLTDHVPTAPARPGRGPLMARLTFVNSNGEPCLALDATEAGTRKGLALYIVRDPTDVPGVAALGPDALSLDAAGLADVLVTAGGARLKNAIRDQRLIAGIGNAYSDEILHAARLSPYAPANSLTPEQQVTLTEAMHDILTAAAARAAAVDPTSLKAEKRSGLAVHGRTGQPCPVCGTTIAEVALADSSFQYCPGCQTGGRPLADRRMSRLLK